MYEGYISEMLTITQTNETNQRVYKLQANSANFIHLGCNVIRNYEIAFRFYNFA